MSDGEWDKPGRLRVDAHKYPSAAWRFTSPDYAGLEVVGADIVGALEAFMQAVVDRFPERAGFTTDVIIREVDVDGVPTNAGFATGGDLYPK